MKTLEQGNFKILTIALSAGAIGLCFWSGTCSAQELRAAFAPECPTTNFPRTEGMIETPAIPLAIASSFAGLLVDNGISSIKKTVNPENANIEAQFLEQGLYMYEGDPNAESNNPPPDKTNTPKPIVKPSHKMGCLVVAVGEFTVAEYGVQGWKLPFKSERPDPKEEDRQTSSNWRIGNTLGLMGPATLALYMEATRVFSSDKTAITWRPVRLYISKYLNDSIWGGKSRSTSIEIRLYKPGIKEAFLSQTFAFGAVRKPVDKNSKDFDSSNIGTWSTLPAAPALPANFKPLKEGRAFAPYTLEVRVVEAPKPYMLAQAFAGAIETNKDAIKKEASNAIDQNAKITSNLTAEDATLDAINIFLTTLQTVATTCTTDKTKDDTGKFACLISRDKALTARQKADLSCKSNAVPSCDSLPEVPNIRS
ncbi:hypothetical protein [Azotobacter chroococcum]|uniref:hypothetical protein n=1 Tax=Azotobacter chroococcum TaxID=353 RepID=UPI0012FDC97A|nr:hypothetical protein [Azotobacter chroococcum]